MSRICVYTDEPVQARGIRASLGLCEGVELCAVYSTVQELLTEGERCRPDVLLLDLTPEVNFGTLTELRARIPKCRIVLWARSVPVELAGQAFELGIHGILRKTLPEELLSKCIAKVSQGELWFEKNLIENLLSARTINLSRREGQLVRLLAQGLSNRDIANILRLKEGTVKVYLSKLYQKAGVKDRFELALYGLKNLSDLPASGPVRIGFPSHDRPARIASAAPASNLRSLVMNSLDPRARNGHESVAAARAGQ